MIWSKLIYFCVCFLLFVSMCRSDNHTVNEDLQKFLSKRLQYVNNELKTLLDQSSSYNKDLKTNIKFQDIKTVSLTNSYVTANIFSLFNNTYVFLDISLFYLVINDNTIELSKHVGFSEIEQNISFIRTVEYNNLGIIFVALPSGFSEVYGYFFGDWFFIQTISNAHQATDAKFFINENNLYLVITNTLGSALTPTSIYKWTGAHFDEIDKILTKDASAVLTFSNQESEVIIISQDSPNHKTRNFLVLEFNNDHLRKIQLVLTNTFKHIVSYEFQDKRYFVVFEEVEESTLYWWDGAELVSWMKFNNYREIHKILTVSIDNIPVIFLIQKDKLLIFSHSLDNLKLISEIHLNESYKSILDMDLISYNNKSTLLIFMLTNENKLKYTLMPFTVTFREVDAKTKEADVLLQCLRNLEEYVEASKNKLELIAESSKKIIQTNEPLEYTGRMNVAASVTADSANVKSQSTTTKFQHQATELKNTLGSLKTRLNKLNPNLDNLFREGDSIDGQLVIVGELHVEQLLAKNLHVNYLNGVRWTPDRWLSYSKPQTITGQVFSKQLHTKNLDVSVQNRVFKDFALQIENVKAGNLTVLNSLTANRIYAPEINEIPFADVYLRSKPEIIRGVKTFDNLSANKMESAYLNEVNTSQTLKELSDFVSGKLEFSSNLNIKNLNFQEIDGVHWNIFKDSVFRIGITNRITGNLTSDVVKLNKLYAKTVSGIDTNTLFTTTTDQIVTSNLQFGNIIAENVICNTINNVDFKKDVITSENSIIKGPVRIDNVRIPGNLHINGPFDLPSLKVGDHIIGTNETDLLQIYRNKVKIIGNLLVSNIVIPSRARVTVNNEEFRGDLSTDYWCKSQNQEIPSHFEALNGVSTPHVTTILLNNVFVSSYLLNNLEDKLPTNLIFENTTILGNVIINSSLNHIPDLRKLDTESVKITGTYNIASHKTVQGTVRVGNLKVNYLDGVEVSKTLTRGYSGKISGTKVFENLIVSEHVVSSKIFTNVLNNFHLETVKDAAMFIDVPQEIDALMFYDMGVKNLKTSYINKINVDEYLEYVNDIDAMTTLNDVTVNGNVQLKSVKELSYINNYDVNDLLANILKLDGNINLKNKFRFLGNVYAENVEVKYVNNINFPDLIQRLLYRDWDQNITASYTFEKLNAPNIFVPQINNILTNNLINTKETNLQNLLVWGGIQLFSPKFTKSVNVEILVCSLQDAVNSLKNLPTRYWNTIHVSQNISLWDENCDLHVILKKSVNAKSNNVIAAPVVFEHHISANNVYLQKLINGVDINEIVNDALVKGANEQIVIGHKRFSRFSASNVFAEGNVDIPTINDIDIVNLNQSIIHKDNIYNTLIRGSKVFFNGLQSNRLISDKISSLNPQSLVSLANLQVIPKAYFHSLEIENDLNIESVNGINISYILSERLLRFSHEEQVAYGTYFVHGMHIIGDTNMPRLNNMSIDDIVLDTDIQTISSIKSFTQDLVIEGNLAVDLVNEQDLSESYKESVLLGENIVIQGSIKFNNVSMVTNDIRTDSINGVPIRKLNELLLLKVPVNTEVVRNSIKKMEDIVATSRKIAKDVPIKYLYLEKSEELQISIPNISSAEIFDMTDSILLHVMRHELGSKCGLPDFCNCPFQESIEITPQRSISSISEIATQRIFSYEEDRDMIIDVVTNSVSTSEACRTNESIALNETTSVMWMLYSKHDTFQFYSEHIMGYISDIEYFYDNENTYMIISRSYDPVNNTHDISSLVFKFSKDKGEIELIQSIETTGAWALHLFRTAQGITLIVGSILNTEKLNRFAGAEIYRFNQETEKFMLLRKVPSSGCTAADAAVFESDSFIILAQNNMPLHVLKYHPKYDNYYFYQNIFFDSPVTGISVFNVGDFAVSDVYLCVVTESGNFYIYGFQFIQGWQMVSSGEIEGLQKLLPFLHDLNQYLFAVSTKVSYLLKVIKHS